MAVEEILPGVFHWTAVHEKIRIPVHSYYLAGPRGLIDPMLPAEGIEWFREQGPPREILLTNRHHYRHSGRFAPAFGTAVRCHRAGLHEFKRGENVEPFEHGDELPGGILALEVGALCPEETALYFRVGEPGGRGDTGAAGRQRKTATGGARAPRRAARTPPAGVLAFGDAVIREEGSLDFVPDKYMGDDPEAVKRGLRAALRRLLERDFDHLLFAHGEPLVGGGKEALRDFLNSE